MAVELQAGRLIDELQRRLDLLRISPFRDREAQRHSDLVLPVLTSPAMLGWKTSEVLNQRYYLAEPDPWRETRPKRLVPDIVVQPLDAGRGYLVVEEKRKQASVSGLRQHIGQISKYQDSLGISWALLTDGNIWLLRMGEDEVEVVDSVADWRRALPEMQRRIGRAAVMERIEGSGRPEIILVSTTPQGVLIEEPTKHSPRKDPGRVVVLDQLESRGPHYVLSGRHQCWKCLEVFSVAAIASENVVAQFARRKLSHLWVFFYIRQLPYRLYEAATQRHRGYDFTFSRSARHRYCGNRCPNCRMLSGDRFLHLERRGEFRSVDESYCRTMEMKEVASSGQSEAFLAWAQNYSAESIFTFARRVD